MKNKKVIIWDFNGTILDDVHASLASVNDMLLARNLPLISIEQYKSYVDTPIIKFYEHIFDDVYSMDFNLIAKEFDEGYERHLPQNALMPDVSGVLEYFKKEGKLQTVVSASNKEKISARLKSYGLYGYFDKVLARSDYRAADKEYLAKEYFEIMKINPRDAVVIGDCVADWKMAQTLGTSCILTTQGHQGRAEFEETDAVIIDSLRELLNITL